MDMSDGTKNQWYELTAEEKGKFDAYELEDALEKMKEFGDYWSRKAQQISGDGDYTAADVGQSIEERNL